MIVNDHQSFIQKLTNFDKGILIKNFKQFNQEYLIIEPERVERFSTALASVFSFMKVIRNILINSKCLSKSENIFELEKFLEVYFSRKYRT